MLCSADVCISLAGADTSAISLRSIFYHLLKNPSTYHKVVNEIDEADAGGRLSRIVSYEESLRLPYLQAVIKEAHRICPPVGMMLERVVPPGGAAFGDTLLPGGTIVGINSWVPCRDASIYPEPNTFRPERWLEADEGRLKLMERNHFVVSQMPDKPIWTMITDWDRSSAQATAAALGRMLLW